VLHKGGHYAALIRVRDKWYIKEDATVRGEFYRPDNLLKQ
jgi:hypothetical protein